MELLKLKRRAVAPIIATLLMVAIAVVGGILIFVFAQGFFEDTQIVAPTIEQVTIFGYNATDRTQELQTHAGVTIEQLTDNSINNRLGGNEEFFVFLRNSGGGEVLISSVSLYGSELDPVADPGTDALGPISAEGEWALSTDGRNFCGCQILGPGQEGTLIISYDDEINGEVKVGRPMLLTIETGGGTKFTKQVVNGRDVG